MTQEDKDLFIKDLCTRLPYKVKLNVTINDIINNNYASFDDVLESIDTIYDIVNNEYDAKMIKPYLFPMSSITEEQIIEIWNDYRILLDNDSDIVPNPSVVVVNDINNYINWLNAHHFDYRGLIDKGLAIDCTNLNIY